MSYGASHGSNTEAPASAAARRDYNEEGRKLVESLGLRTGGDRYNDADVIWRDKDHAKGRAGEISVGNQGAARNAKTMGFTHVVNCTDDMPNYCEADAGMNYLRWNVSYWPSAGNGRSPLAADKPVILAFVQTLFDFLDAAMGAGGRVLVHCLAGAHRAGTTGCLILMRQCGLSAQQAIKAAKQLRHIINPIGNLPGLLKLYEEQSGAPLDPRQAGGS